MPNRDLGATFAQNFEDVMLWRALGSVERGVYIDVGANHPDNDSVTKRFYDEGWSGFNIEPLEELYEALVRQRPRDVCLKVCAGKLDDVELSFYDVSGTGLSTASKNASQKYLDEGLQVQESKVQSITLDSLVKAFKINEVHFLKVDVEGMEADVLAGFSFDVCRPWIVVIESLDPISKQMNHSEWEPYLLSKSYVFVHFDGLNRFYVSQERVHLQEHFLEPPNIFDPMITALMHIRNERPALKRELQDARKKMQELSMLKRDFSSQMEELIELKQQLVELEEAQERLRLIENSRVWRMSKPYRVAMSALKGVLRSALRALKFVRQLPVSVAFNYWKEHGTIRLFKKAKKVVFNRPGAEQPKNRILTHYEAAIVEALKGEKKL